MSTPTSAHGGSIEKLEGRKWACTNCPVTRTRGRRTFGTLNAALNHQRAVHGDKPPTIENGKNTNINGPDDSHHLTWQPWPATGWPKIEESCARLTSDGLSRWEMHAHVNPVSDMVPFWQRGVEAAANGKVIRLEEFLEKMEEAGLWRNASEVLKMMSVRTAPPSERDRYNSTECS